MEHDIYTSVVTSSCHLTVKQQVKDSWQNGHTGRGWGNTTFYAVVTNCRLL